MSLAKIFRPIRWPPAEDGAAFRPGADAGVPRALQVGMQPVTNTSPPGPARTAETDRASREAAWLAMLELVFDETGWPDAD
jgi:hypothetical protein